LKVCGGIDLVKEIFKRFNYNVLSKAESVTKRKDQIFRSFINIIYPYPNTDEIVQKLACIKGIASGSAKHDVDAILRRSFQQYSFQIVLTADDIQYGKPDPQAFEIFLQKSELDSQDVIVVENSPLGAKAATRAGLNVIVVLNNSPLTKDDFVDLIPPDAILLNTKDTRPLLDHWCKNN
jgi:HAD superfamily hydrolase (TIGR01509 family)